MTPRIFIAIWVTVMIIDSLMTGGSCWKAIRKKVPPDPLWMDILAWIIVQVSVSVFVACVIYFIAAVWQWAI